jgi:hypothetical protein
MTTPTGLPAWTRTADHSTYGGDANKANYNDEPIVNPRTDVGADSFQRITADLAAVTRMADFAVLTFSTDASDSSVSVTAGRTMVGTLSTSYTGSSPPAGFPAVTHVSGSVWSVAIGGSYSDDYSVAASFAPAFTGAQCITGAYASRAYVSGTSVYVESATGTGSFTVWIS